MEPHDEFLELCAVSTSGELSAEEKSRLEAHLAECADCRQALRELEAAVDVGVPFLAAKLSPAVSSDSSEKFPSRQGDAKQTASLDAPTPLRTHSNNVGVAPPDAVPRGFAFAQRDGHGRSKINWNYVWLPFAASILLSVALGIYAYRMARSGNVTVTGTVSPASETQIEALEQQMSDAGREREDLRSELTQRDKVIFELRHEIQMQSASLDEMKGAQASLERSTLNDKAEMQQNARDRGTLLQKLDAAQISLDATHVQLDALQQERNEEESRAESLTAQVNDLHAELREREQTLNKQEDLLAHDRDVRELMGARELHIAELYSVARDGVTQKPYGRVFYTKGKSLIFYAYDLDQQAGPRNARTFQAWGQRGPDRREALNLGIFYEDNAAKKRWIVKCDDPKTLTQIHAVFVTVEPKGGSDKPSGTPLLFTDLEIEPNHP
ncbi:MAG: zf-HC2 domain-containing protein [Candidatus Acidiferrales bacterium]